MITKDKAEDISSPLGPSSTIRNYEEIDNNILSAKKIDRSSSEEKDTVEQSSNREFKLHNNF